jgi:lysophospholipase L1-like esterase
MTHLRLIIVAWCVGSLLSVCLIAVTGELLIRTIHLLRDGIPFFESPSKGVGAISLDPRLGWRATPNYKLDLAESTAKDHRIYQVHRSQSAQGFRTYGNVATRKAKLLVIGDSVTQATAVSDDKTYHSLLGTTLGVEVFAYGAGGYGTLQEYLILDEVYDAIKPTMILWQFCGNDFINNDHALEVESVINNNGWIRPYFEDGQVVLRSPKPAGLQAREWVQHHSRFLYFVMTRLDRLRVRSAHETVEFAIEREGFNHPEFVRSVTVTDTLMGRVRARVGQTPMYAFNCTTDEPYTTAFETIARHYNIHFWRTVAAAVHDAVNKGEDVFASDGDHWNEYGHSLIAAVLLQQLKPAALPVPGREGS